MFLLPAAIFFVWYQAWPIIRVVWISFTDYKFLAQGTRQLGGLRQLCRSPERSFDVGQPVAGRPVHDDVPARHDHHSAPGGDPGRPGREPAPRDLPRDPPGPRSDPEHADLRLMEVDVQLPDRPDQSLPGRCARAVHLSECAAVAGRHGADLALDRDHGGLVGLGYTASSSSPASRRSRRSCRRRRASTAPTSGRCSGTSPCRACNRS